MPLRLWTLPIRVVTLESKMHRTTTARRVTKIRFALNDVEAKLLATMAENELFRMRFVNPRLPGYLIDPDVLRHCQSVTMRLSEMTKKQKGLATPDLNVTGQDADAL